MRVYILFTTECCCHVFLNAMLNGQILRRLDRTFYTGKVYLPCVFSYVLSAHRNEQISIHNLSSYKYKAFHQYGSFDELSNGSTWCSFCHTRDDHRYELAISASVLFLPELLGVLLVYYYGDPEGWPLRPNAHSWSWSLHIGRHEMLGSLWY